jgi:DNA polymerase elongation subunit (family B)
LKIYTQNPPLVNKFRSVFEKGFTIEGDMFSNTTFESNIPYVLRFLVDK